MTSPDPRPGTVIERAGAPSTVVLLPDEPGEAVCRWLVQDESARMEIGVSVGGGPREVYVVAVDHCTRLTATQARAAGRHLLSAAAAAESHGG